MTSTRIKNLARAIQRQRPGMKYTEALRLAQGKGIRFDPMSADPSVTDILRAAGYDVTPITLTPGTPGTLDPFALAEGQGNATARPLERGMDPDAVPLEPRSVDSVVEEALRAKAERVTADAEEAKAPQLIEVDEWHSMTPSAESKARFNEILRKGRSAPPERDAKGRPIVYADPMGDFVPLSRTPAPTIGWTPKEPFTLASMQEARARGNVERMEMEPASQDQFKGVFDTVRNFMQEHPELSTEQVARHMHEELFGKTPDGTIIGRTNGSTEPVWFEAPEPPQTSETEPFTVSLVEDLTAARHLKPEDLNIAIAGHTASGKTHFLRSLVTRFLDKGWWVSIADLKGDSFSDFRKITSVGRGRVNSVRNDVLDPSGSWVYESEARDFIQGLAPGHKLQPHLVVIDDGDSLFEDPDLTPEQREKLTNALEHLMLDPHTIVAFQSNRFSPNIIPGSLFQHCGARVLLGKSTKLAQRSFFGGVVPADELESFELDSREWTGDLKKDAGLGIIWEGDKLKRHH